MMKCTCVAQAVRDFVRGAFQPMARNVCFLAGVLLLTGAASLLADERDFRVQGVTLRLAEASAEVQARYQAMRFNRALGVWNVDITLTNCGARILRAPFLVTLDHGSDTVRAISPDGYDGGNTNTPFFDLSSYAAGGSLAPGAVTPKRTVSLASTGAAPRMGGRVYSRLPAEPFAFAVAQVLDASGQPLSGVDVLEAGPQGARSVTNEADTARAMLGRTAGEYTWRFEKAGYLPVWRRSVLGDGTVGALASPRLSPRSALVETMTGAEGGRLSVQDRGLLVTFPAGAFAQDTAATLTPLDAQSLPALLPSGWSPLQAFWLEFGSEPGIAGAGVLTLWDDVQAGETAALVRLDPVDLSWKTVALTAGNGGNSAVFSVAGSGAYAVVVGDNDPALMPPAPFLGQALLASSAAFPTAADLSASGRVVPDVAMASEVPERVTARASVAITNAAGPVPSGLILQADVAENYRMQDGIRFRTPQYTTTLVGYQRPGDAVARTLHAHVGLRPQLLFSSARLAEATVTLDVHAPGVYASGLLDADGGRIESQGVALLAGWGDLTGPQKAELRVLSPLDFTDVTAGETVLTAFEVKVGGIVEGRRLVARISTAVTNGFFVLARVVSEGGRSGLEPVERLTRQASGVLTGAEPDSEPRLPGVTRTGHYVVLALALPQALVSGVVRDRSGTPAAGVALQVAGQPWLTFSGVGGQYRLLAPAGACQIVATEAATGDTGFADVTVDPELSPAAADLATGLAGPRILTVSPANGAVAVPRVSSVMVTFSEAIDPATLGTNGVRVVDTNGVAVAAALRLNLRGTVATLLPNVRLAPAMRYTVCVTNAIADPGGQGIAGARAFVFTTARDTLDRTGAQVISYEPTNGLARMVGSPGTADPEAPVILVNETAGSTATVLSRPDGSFDNSIAADVDDFLSAVVVNENGTRNTVTVSRQLFRDGSVGLFNGGGILEAESDGGPVRVIVDPGAIANKTKFKMVSIPIQELMQLITNAPPVGAQALAGFHIERSGDTLASNPHVSLPVDPATLDLPAGADPEKAQFLLTRPRQVNGETVYQMVDEMTYEGGRVATHSWVDFAFDAVDTMVCVVDRAAQGGVLVSGRVMCESASGQRAVPDATVMAVTKDSDLSVHGRIPKGTLVSMSNQYGAFKLKAPIYLGENAINMVASSLYFPGQYGIGSAWVPRDASLVGATVVFTPQTQAALTDTVQPTLSLLASPTLPMVSQTVDVLVRGTDNATAPRLTLELIQTEPTDLTSASVTITPGTTETLAQTTKSRYQVAVSQEGRVVLRATATDGAGYQNTAQYVLTFTAEPRLPAISGTDRSPPYAVWTLPRNHGTDEDAFQPIRILFNEPIAADVLANLQNAIQVVPAAGTLTGQLSADRRELTLYATLRPDTAYSVTLSGEIHDLAGNAFFQYPSDQVQSYSFSFHTRAVNVQTLTEVKRGAGVVSDPQGTYYYVLDQGNTWSSSSLRVYGTNATGVILWQQGVCHVANYPRELVYIGPYDYKIMNGSLRHGVLVALTGGLVGDLPPWLSVVDVADPVNPVVIATSEINYSSGASVSRLQWSAPSLGYLQIGGTANGTAAIGIVNLQLFLYTQSAPQGGPSGFNPFSREVESPGVDLNGDGDYVDSGESIPHLNGQRAVAGLENGGLVAAFSMPPEPNGDYATEVIKDLVVAQGGRFVAVVHGPGRGSNPPGYRTLAADGVPLNTFQGDFVFACVPTRLAVFQGVSVGGSTNALQQVNLAVVTGGKGQQVLTFLDITDPRYPVELKDLTIPSDWGKPWSVQLAKDGRLMVGTTSTSFQSSPGLAIIDPQLLLLPAQAGIHPALVGIMRGTGNSSYSFVGLGSDRFAVAQGGLALASVPVAFPSTFEARSIEVVDAAGASGPRSSANGEIELVTHAATTSSPGAPATSHRLDCSATPPSGVPVPFGQPVWSVPDIPAQAAGLSVRFDMPDYNRSLFNWGNFLLFLCTPDEHKIKCGRHEVIVHVYPKDKLQAKATSQSINEKLGALMKVPDRVGDLIKTLPGWYVQPSVVLPSGVINYENEWKESPGSALAYCTCLLEAKMDPLLGARVRAGCAFRLPAVPVVGGRGLDIGAELLGQFVLSGSISRDENGQWSVGTLTPGGEIALSASGVLNLQPLAEVSVGAESKISLSGTVGISDDYKKWMLKNCTAEWSGLTMKISVKLYDGNLELAAETPLIPRTTLLSDDNYELPFSLTL